MIKGFNELYVVIYCMDEFHHQGQIFYWIVLENFLIKINNLNLFLQFLIKFK